jgi:hypothetical protein
VGVPSRCFGKAAGPGSGDACPCFALRGVTGAPTPKLETISPQRKGGEDSTAMKPLKDKGGAAGREDAGGARALPLIQLRALCTVGTGVSLTREKGGASGGTVAPNARTWLPRV